MTKRLGALISCAFILLQPFSAAFGDPLTGPDPVAGSPSTNGAPSPAPQVPSLANTITPEVASLLAPSASQQQTILDVAQTGGTINFTGDFVNKDHLYIISTSSQYLTANLFASGNIINSANASISTMIPTGVTGAVTGLNLVLNAGANIINAGTISSAGSLTMSAANSIINTVVPQTQPVVPVMQAQGDLAMQAVNIINQGVVQSALANINIATMVNSLAINAMGGVFQAPTAINIITPDILTGGSLDILGGDFVSKSLNVQSGIVNLAASSISSPLNLEAGSASVQCKSGNLVIGEFSVSGKSPSFGTFAAFSSLSAEEDPTYIYNSEGDLIFIADTIAPSLSLSSGRNILNDGASTISATSGLSLIAGKDINLIGLKSITSESVVNLFAAGSIDVSGVAVTSGPAGSVYLVADQHIVLEDTTLNSGYGGIHVVAGGDISGKNTIMDSSLASANPGAIFLASIGGAIDLGSKSVITTGKTAPGTVVVGPGAIYAISVNAYNGLNLGTVSAPSGEIVLGSGIETIGNRFIGWLSKTIDGANHLGSGGITAGDLSIRTDGSLQNSRLLISPSNGNLNANSILGNGGLITILAPFDVTVTEGINNVSTGTSGGTIILSFGEHINIPLGINNDSLNGSGGEIYVEAHAPAGFVLGQDVKLSNNAATDGGLINGSNAMGPLSIATSGLQTFSNGNGSQIYLSTIRESFEHPADIKISGEVINLDGKNNGAGGTLLINADGAVVLSNSSITANGSGDSKGGDIGINAWKAVSISNVSLAANGGGNGDGGGISIYGATLDANNLSISANGQGLGKGGWLSFYLTDSAEFTGSGIKAEAKGANGGYLGISSDGQVTVNNKWFDITPIGGISGAGNGGIINLISFHDSVTTSGNFYVDGVDEGNGGQLYIWSEGDSSLVTLGSTGQSKYYARGGTTGGNGGRIDIRVGGDLLVLDTAILDASVRGENGNGGTLVLNAGHSASFGSLYLNKSLSVNGRGNGNGGGIDLEATTGEGGGGGPVGTFALVGPGDGPGLFINATLNANGAGTGFGGAIGATLRGGSGELRVANNLNANGGTEGRGGEVYLESHNSLSIGTAEAPVVINTRGGTVSGDGGFITVQGYSDMDLSHASLFADARGAGFGGTVLIAQNEGGGPVGSFAFAGPSLQSESDPVFVIPQKVDATGAGSNTKGGGITVRTPGSIHFSRQGNVMTANGHALSLGGTISVNAAKDIVIDNGVILTSLATGGDADGGQIYLNAGKSVTINGTLNVTGSGSGSGGKVVVGDESSISSITVSRDILADGGATGSGGEINLKASGENAVIMIGSTEQAKNLAARGGTAGGAGGKITLESAGDLILNGAFISTSTRAGAEKAGDITLKAGTAGSGRIQFTGDITASSVAGGDAGNVDISYSSSEPLEITGHIYARATGSGKGGEISFNNALPTIKMIINNTVSADSKTGEDGTVTFNKDSGLQRNVDVIGSGALEGKLELLETGSVDINLSGTNNINLEKVDAAGPHVSISAPTLGSRILIDSTAEIKNTSGSISLKAPEITNNADIKAKDFVEFSSDIGLKVKGTGSLHVTGGPGEVKVSAGAGKTLSFEGIQTFDAAGGKVIWSAPGTGGFINVLENNNQNIGAGSSLEVITSHIALRENVGLKTTNGGSITVDSGDANAVARLTAVNAGKTTTLTTSGGGGSITLKGAGVTIAGSDSKVELDTSSVNGNGGSITLSATTENVQNSTAHLTLKSTGNIGGDITATSAQAAVNLNKTDITADTLNGNLPTSEGGRVSINAAKTATLSGPIQSNSNHKGGSIEITGSNIAVGNDPPNSPPLSLKANGENGGGTIKLTATTGNVDLTKFHTELSIFGENGNGGTFEITAPNGSIKFEGELAVNGKGTGDGGSILLRADSFNFSESGSVALTANSNGKGGKINISTNVQSIILGNNSNGFRLSASGATKGGEIRVESGKNLTFFGGITTTGNIGKIELAALEKLRIQGSLSIIDNTDHGVISLSGNVVEIRNNVGLSASGASGNRTIVIEAKIGTHAPAINIGEAVGITTSSKNSGGAILISSEGSINTSALTLDSSGSAGSGRGTIQVIAKENLVMQGAVTINNRGSADNATGSRILISAAQTDFSNANLNVSADSNPTTGVGGLIVIESKAGNLDLSNLSNSISTNANDGQAGRIVLKAFNDISLGRGGLSATSSNGFAGSIDLSSQSSTAIIRINGALTAQGAQTTASPNLVSLRSSNSGTLTIIIDRAISSSGAVAFSSPGDIVVRSGTSSGGSITAGSGVFAGQLNPDGYFVGSGIDLAGAANTIDIDMTNSFAPANGSILITSALANHDIRIQGNTTFIGTKIVSNNGNILVFGDSQISSSAKIQADMGFISMQTPSLNHSSGAGYQAKGNIDLIGRSKTIDASSSTGNTNLAISGSPWNFASQSSMRVLAPNISLNSMGRSSDTNIELLTPDTASNAIITVAPSSGLVTSNGSLKVIFGGTGNNQIRTSSVGGRGVLGGGKVEVFADNGALLLNGVDIHGLESTTLRGGVGTSIGNSKVTGTLYVDILAGPARTHGTIIGGTQTTPAGLATTGLVQCFGIVQVFGSNNEALALPGRSIIFDAATEQIDINGSTDIRAEFHPISFSDTLVSEGEGRQIPKRNWQTATFSCSAIGSVTLIEQGGIINIIGNGELLIATRDTVDFSVLNTRIKAKKDSIIHLELVENIAKIRNIHDSKRNSLLLVDKTIQKELSISPGEELMIGKSKSRQSHRDEVARRKIESLNLHDCQFQRSDYSFPSLMQETFLGLLLDTDLKTKALKTAAAVCILKGKNEPYRAGE